MKPEFSPEEINEIIRAARVWAPGFSEEKLQSLVNSQHQLADSGFCEAAWGMVRLQQEKRIPCTEALDGYEHLLQENTELEEKVADHRAKLQSIEAEIKQAKNRYQEVKEAIEQAKKELQAVQTERQKEEKELVVFRKKAEREKQHVDKEAEGYRQKANMTKADVDIARQIKIEVESQGFSLKLALELSHEFAGHESARDELAKAIQEYGTLSQANAALVERGKAQEEALESKLNRLQSEKDRRQTVIKSLEVAHHNLEGVLSQLQIDIATEEELRRFYQRYQSASTLMEYLASWRGIFFAHCNNPLFALTGAFDHRTSGARFCVEKPPIRRCPCCNYPDAVYDSHMYQALNWPIGAPYKLQLGE